MPRETKWMKNAATGISQFRSISLVVQQEGIEVEWNVFNVCPVVVVGDCTIDTSSLTCNAVLLLSLIKVESFYTFEDYFRRH